MFMTAQMKMEALQRLRRRGGSVFIPLRGNCDPGNAPFFQLLQACARVGLCEGGLIEEKGGAAFKLTQLGEKVAEGSAPWPGPTGEEAKAATDGPESWHDRLMAGVAEEKRQKQTAAGVSPWQSTGAGTLRY